ncbi:MAG: HlyC/CorC family transporter [Phycisphaeraceae bacterium]|nr:HlyC/CorC family transporter [Phycisphaeraceae bacterium]
MTFLLLITLPFLLAASGFFSGCETALFSLSRHQRGQLARDKRLSAVTITTLLSETRGLLITLLLGNMTVNVIYFAVTTLLVIRWRDAGWVGPAGSTALAGAALLLVVLFGEVLPKLLAARLTLTWALLLAVPLWMVHRALGPLRLFCQAFIITPLARLIAPRHKPPQLSVEEFESLLSFSQRHGAIDANEEQLLQQVVELGQMKVRELMTPRVDIVAHDLAEAPEALLGLIRITRLRHVPVFEGSLDQIVGFVYSRQTLLSRPRTAQQVRQLIRPVNYVPQAQRADQLLAQMRKSASTFAIVVDEYGGTAGLITLEDVVEQMVGEIPGAFDEQNQPEVEQLGHGRWRCGAELPVREWTAVFKQHATSRQALDALDVASTVGGLLMARLGRLPKVGDRVLVGNVALTCDLMRGKRVERVLIELTDTAKNGTVADSDGARRASARRDSQLPQEPSDSSARHAEARLAPQSAPDEKKVSGTFSEKMGSNPNPEDISGKKVSGTFSEEKREEGA